MLDFPRRVRLALSKRLIMARSIIYGSVLLLDTTSSNDFDLEHSS